MTLHSICADLNVENEQRLRVTANLPPTTPPGLGLSCRRASGRGACRRRRRASWCRGDGVGSSLRPKILECNTCPESGGALLDGPSKSNFVTHHHHSCTIGLFSVANTVGDKQRSLGTFLRPVSAFRSDHELVKLFRYQNFVDALSEVRFKGGFFFTMSSSPMRGRPSVISTVFFRRLSTPFSVLWLCKLQRFTFILFFLQLL